MLTTVDQFRRRVTLDCPSLISELQSLTGRYGSEEASAWERSLKQMSRIFQADSFKPLHLYFGSRGNLALEYQLPASSSWCDVVLLGKHNAKSSAVIVELKDWQTAGDEPGSYEGLVWRHGTQELHPSDQVRGYTEYCRRFHSAVQDHNADVHGCVLFTRDRWTHAYTAEPNARLAVDYPLFTTDSDDVEKAFPAYFRERLTEPDTAFAAAFERGHYRQSRGFVAQVGAQILDRTTSAFELLDGQRKAFAECRSVIRDAFHGAGKKKPPKRVVIVRGPPGSGKSVITARLWASLVTDKKLPDGNVIITTTSASQNKNWSYLFEKASKERGARGVVRKATNYSPITTQELGRLRKKRGAKWLGNAGDWRKNVKLLRSMNVTFRDGTDDNANLVSIVDEAHALINPEHTEGRGQFGFVVTVGPQAYHIIRSSMLSVFLLDPLQGFRQRENTTIDDIRAWSKELGAGDPIEISLEGMQFRCAGSREYVSWVESLLGGAKASANAKLASTFRNQGMEVRLFDTPDTWESALRERVVAGSGARLLSTYSRPWATKGVASPHELPDSEMDFYESYRAGAKAKKWSKVWNFVPRGDDYTWFVAGHPAGKIAEDPLCEVGCPYAVRGFDYDYVGIAWLDDLVWRDGQWRVNSLKVHESGVSTLTNAARREERAGKTGPASQELLDRVRQAYRILFTRGIKGVYLWIPDEETRQHVIGSLG